MPWRRFNNPTPLAANAITLGMLIIDPDDPPRNAHNPFTQNPPAVHVTPFTLENYQATSKAETTLSITPSVGSVAHLLGNKFNAVTSSVQADLVTCHELTGQDAVDTLFRQACSQDTTRQWFEKTLEDGNDVFFIVGFRTFTNPLLTRTARRTTGAQASLSAPVISAVSGIPAEVLPISVDPGVTAGGEKDRECAQSFRVLGEFILEIKYCKVKFRWFSSRKMEKSSLGECRWKVSWAVRGEEDYDDDVVDVSLEMEGEE